MSVSTEVKDLCEQCGLPNPLRGTVEFEGKRFCCHGCVTAHHILSASGLRDALEDPEYALPGKERAQPTGNRYEEFDDPNFAELYVTSLESDSRVDEAVSEKATYQDEDEERTDRKTPQLLEVELWLEGVHCISCLRLLENLPEYMPGVVFSRLNLHNNLLTLRWESDQVSLSRIAVTLDSLGYPSHPLRGKSRRELQRKQERKQLFNLAIAGALAGNTMLVHLALYLGMLEGMEAAHETFFRWVSFGLGTVSLLFPGRTFFQGAWSAIRTRTSHMDLPIALGLGAGGLAGTYNTIRGAGEIYFDSLAVLVFLLLVGRFLQMRQQRRAGDAIELLYSLTPSTARRLSPESRQIVEGAVRQLENDSAISPSHDVVDRVFSELNESEPMSTVVPVQALQPGDWVEVRSNDSVPVDGVVVWGESSLDTSLLTGESIPVPVGRGEQVAAGSSNRGAKVIVRVDAMGESTRVGKLMKLVESASAEKAPVAQLADRIGAWFVIVVMALSIATFSYWTWRGSSAALDHAIALLIVACPCALGLATPLTLAVMIGRAARRRILIRGADVVEALARPGRIYLDKTGTLTKGEFKLLKWNGDESLQGSVLALQQHSSHPLATAFVRDLTTKGIVPASNVRQVEQDPRGGIQGIVDGMRIAIGNEAFLRQLGVTIEEQQQEELAKEARRGNTPVFVAEGDSVGAIVSCGDSLRDDAVSAVRQLKSKGWEVGILSGDHPRVVEAIAEAVSIDKQWAQGGMTPEEKLSVVQAEQQSQAVVMVGDGVNDAAALAAARVGIAVKNGAEASLEAAPIYLAQEGLKPIVDLVMAARKTMFTVRAALVASLAYNGLAVVLAAQGLISPLVAAILMPLSSLTVVGLSFSPRTFEKTS